MSSSIILKKLQSTNDTKAQKLYRSLVDHYKSASCSICQSYPKYKAIVVKGDLFEHVYSIASIKIGPSDFFTLQEYKLIILEEIAPRVHRITFR